MTQIKSSTGVAVAAILAASALQALPANAQTASKDNWAAITKCAAISDDKARLICMDAVMSTAGVPDAAQNEARSEQAMPAPKAQPAAPKAAQAPAPAPAPAATDSRKATTLSDQQREAFFPDTKEERQDDEVNRIEVTLASVSKHNSKFTLTDTDGVIWRQLYTPSSKIPPKAGQSMTVQKNSLGGYLCRVESTPTFRCKPNS